VDIVLASPRGFCAGVERAIESVERALQRFGHPVYVRHEIVHNRHVVEALRAKGAVFVEEPAQVPRGSLLVFSAHGVSPAVRREAEERELRVIDATCPLVSKVHKEAQRMAREGCEIVMIGHRGHVEVEGTMGQAPERMHLVEGVEDVEALDLADPARVGCVTQTTLSVDDTREIMQALEHRFPEIQLPRKDDICYATQNRQDAVKRLADETDMLLVVGAPESSNSRRLVEVASKRGTPSYLVQDADEIDPVWLEGMARVGVMAAASAPEILVTRVVERLEALAPDAARVCRQPEVDEGIVFRLPSLLR
jgi:4-hydroxy-3-methylbut-2-enyl diphosphate reductase